MHWVFFIILLFATPSASAQCRITDQSPAADFSLCVRQAFEKVEELEKKLFRFRFFKEKLDFPVRIPVRSLMNPKDFSKVRTQFSNEDLGHLEGLILRHRNALQKFRNQILEVLRKNQAQFQGFQPDWILSWLLLLQKNWFQKALVLYGEDLPKEQLEILKRTKIAPSEYFARKLLPNHKGNPLSGLLEARYFFLQFQESSEEIAFYKRLRDRKKRKFEEELQSYRIGVIDSGLDYKRYPKLEDKLSSNSYDYSDEDSDVFLPAIGGLAHGTNTVRIIDKTLQSFDPAFSEDYGIDFWKIRTDRSVLIGNPYFWFRHWEGFRYPEIEAILRQMKSPDPPQIVNVATQVPPIVWKGLRAAEDPEILKQSKWLWVMSSGNEKKDLSSLPYCWATVPIEYDPREKKICVGTVKKEEDKYYVQSNYGYQVDLYVDSSSFSLPSSYTSHATPLISAFALLLLKENPDLSVKELKEKILSYTFEEPLRVNALESEQKIKVLTKDSIGEF